MSIIPFLGGENFDPEVQRIMGLAYEMVRVGLHLADHRDHLSEPLGKIVIELEKSGERDPNRLCELTLQRFGHAPPPKA